MSIYSRILLLLMVVIFIMSILGSSNDIKNLNADNSATLRVNLRKYLRKIRSEKCSSTNRIKFECKPKLNSFNTSWKSRPLQNSKRINSGVNFVKPKAKRMLNFPIWQKRFSKRNVPASASKNENFKIFEPKLWERRNLHNPKPIILKYQVSNVRAALPLQEKNRRITRDAKSQNMNKTEKINNASVNYEMDNFLRNVNSFLDFLEGNVNLQSSSDIHVKTTESPNSNREVDERIVGSLKNKHLRIDEILNKESNSSDVNNFRRKLKSFLDSLVETVNFHQTSTVKAITKLPEKETSEKIMGPTSTVKTITKLPEKETSEKIMGSAKHKNVENKETNKKISIPDIAEFRKKVNKFLDSLEKNLSVHQSSTAQYDQSIKTTTSQPILSNTQPISKDIKNLNAHNKANPYLKQRKFLRPIRSKHCVSTIKAKFKRETQYNTSSKLNQPKYPKNLIVEANLRILLKPKIERLLDLHKWNRSRLSKINIVPALLTNDGLYKTLDQKFLEKRNICNSTANTPNVKPPDVGSTVPPQTNEKKMGDANNNVNNKQILNQNNGSNGANDFRRNINSFLDSLEDSVNLHPQSTEQVVTIPPAHYDQVTSQLVVNNIEQSVPTLPANYDQVTGQPVVSLEQVVPILPARYYQVTGQPVVNNFERVVPIIPGKYDQVTSQPVVNDLEQVETTLPEHNDQETGQPVDNNLEQIVTTLTAQYVQMTSQPVVNNLEQVVTKLPAQYVQMTSQPVVNNLEQTTTYECRKNGYLGILH